MNRYLCISVTLIDDRFHGLADHGDTEWPPSPYRLFQAMLAGSRTGRYQMDWTADKSDAFRWLENISEIRFPEIFAPQESPTDGYTMFCPNNDSDRKPNRNERLTSKQVKPYRLDENSTIHYLWQIEENEWPDAQRHVGELCVCARRIMAFGWGIDMAFGNGRVLHEGEVQQLSGIRWVPWKGYLPASPFYRRIPVQGSLQDLEASYESFVQSIQGMQYSPPRKPCVFDRQIYLQQTLLPKRPYVVFELRDFEHDRLCSLNPIHARDVASWTRYQACQKAEHDYPFDDDSEIYVAGHLQNADENSPRFSYLPLPTVGHRHADGRIRRMLIAEPIGGDGSHIKWVESKLRNARLTDQAGKLKATLLPPPANDHVLSQYTAPSDEWWSVTPVVLPGFDDGKYRKREKLFLKALQQSGIPAEAVESFTIRSAPFFKRAQHPKLYSRPNYLEHFAIYHVYIKFREAMPGPLAIGAGRHCGLGIFAKIST